MVRVEKGESIRKKVYELWVENPYITAREICKKLVEKPSELKKFYKQHGNYINKLLSEYRSYHKFGLPQEAHLPHKRVFVWENVPRKLLLDFLGTDKFFEGLGWKTTANRNGMLVFRGVNGTVHWYKEGLVRLYLRGELQLARAKELFCRAFSWFSQEEWSKYLDVPLREESKHWVFDVGAPMPRFDIRKFERSHGIRIFTDGSHPTSLEVIETEPFWMSEFREVTDAFGKEIKGHLELITSWEKEAKGRRVTEEGFASEIGRFVKAHESRDERYEKLLWQIADALKRKRRKRSKPKPKKPPSLQQRLRRRLRF